MKPLRERLVECANQYRNDAHHDIEDWRRIVSLLDEAENALALHEKKYDSTVARMAGNMAPAFMDPHHAAVIRYLTPQDREQIARESVALARVIVGEVRRLA